MSSTEGSAADTGEPPHGSRSPVRLRGLSQKLLPVVGVVGFLAIWQFCAEVLGVSKILLPPPIEVWSALVDGFANGEFLMNTWVTTQEVILGFLAGSAAGVIVGIAVTRWRFVELAIYPLIVAFQALPKIAVAPLIVTALGLGLASKITISVLVSFFPLLVNVIAGVRSVPPQQVDLLRALSASQGTIYRKIKLPGALPYIFAGLDVAIILSVIGAIVGEFVGSAAGLGYLVQAKNFQLDVPATYAVLVVLMAMGLVFHGVIRLIGRKVVHWQATASQPM